MNASDRAVLLERIADELGGILLDAFIQYRRGGEANLFLRRANDKIRERLKEYADSFLKAEPPSQAKPDQTSNGQPQQTQRTK